MKFHSKVESFSKRSVEHMQTEKSIIRWSDEDIVEFIRKNRNDLISKLLDDQATLREYIKNHHYRINLSEVKLEFVKRALLELQSAPVDLSHYGSLIMEIRKTKSFNISSSRERLFHQNIEAAVKNYIL